MKYSNNNEVNKPSNEVGNHGQNLPSMPPQSSNKNLKIVIGILIVLLLGALGVAGYYIFTNKNISQNNQPTLTNNQNTSINTPTPAQTEENREVYFGKGWEGKYSLVNVQTGETKTFIPTGYTIVDQHRYDQFPRYLILQKDNDLFAYNLENNLSNSIFGSFNDLKLKNNDQARIYPSITEKDKFFVVIYEYNEYNPNEEPGIGFPMPLHTRSYTFDSSTNKLVSVSNVDSYGCVKYDSKNQRFFTWTCREGIGLSAPLSISDMTGKKQREVITQEEFGLTKDNRGAVAVNYENGTFFAQKRGAIDKVVVLDPQLANPTKETYVVSDAIKSQITEAYPHSTTIAKDKNTIIIDGDNSILLLRFDSNKQITQSTYIPDKKRYAHFIFTYNGKLYYQAKDNIRILNLDTWQVEKSLPSPLSEEITLISLTK